jgi:hypothetical protein
LPRDELNGPQPFIVKRQISTHPKIGWRRLADSLDALKITEIHDIDSIPGMKVTWTDADAIKIEIATKNNYRFYELHDPHMFLDKFWEAKNVMQILNLLYTQYGK